MVRIYMITCEHLLPSANKIMRAMAAISQAFRGDSRTESRRCSLCCVLPGSGDFTLSRSHALTLALLACWPVGAAAGPAGPAGPVASRPTVERACCVRIAFRQTEACNENKGEDATVRT